MDSNEERLFQIIENVFFSIVWMGEGGREGRYGWGGRIGVELYFYGAMPFSLYFLYFCLYSSPFVFIHIYILYSYFSIHPFYFSLYFSLFLSILFLSISLYSSMSFSLFQFIIPFLPFIFAFLLFLLLFLLLSFLSLFLSFSFSFFLSLVAQNKKREAMEEAKRRQHQIAQIKKEVWFFTFSTSFLSIFSISIFLFFSFSSTSTFLIIIFRHLSKRTSTNMEMLSLHRLLPRWIDLLLPFFPGLALLCFSILLYPNMDQFFLIWIFWYNQTVLPHRYWRREKACLCYCKAKGTNFWTVSI